jgi:hypothetical protein
MKVTKCCEALPMFDTNKPHAPICTKCGGWSTLKDKPQSDVKILSKTLTAFFIGCVFLFASCTKETHAYQVAYKKGNSTSGLSTNFHTSNRVLTVEEENCLLMRESESIKLRWPDAHSFKLTYYIEPHGFTNGQKFKCE